MRRRSTRAELLLAEAAQAEIIGSLAADGENLAVRCLAACQAARIWRSALVRRYRCRSPGCVSCWDGSLAAWWRGYRSWCQEDANSFAVMLPADYRFAGPIARTLRDVRDRQARSDPAWADVAILGLTDGTEAYILVSPWRIPPDSVIAVLRGRWPTLAPFDACQDSLPMVTTNVRVALAARRRGSAPLRFAIFPQRQNDETSLSTEPDDVIPFLVATRTSPWD